MGHFVIGLGWDDVNPGEGTVAVGNDDAGKEKGNKAEMKSKYSATEAMRYVRGPGILAVLFH